MLFEEFGFQGALCRPAPWFSGYEYFYKPNSTSNQPLLSLNTKEHLPRESSILAGNCIVVESGFSFTHLLPFIEGKCVKHAVMNDMFCCTMAYVSDAA